MSYNSVPLPFSVLISKVRRLLGFSATIFVFFVVFDDFRFLFRSDILYGRKASNHQSKHNMNTEKKVKRHFASKIPPGAEGCVIMTGNVEFLEEPLVMFIRLEKPKQLTGITEVTIDKKFLIVALGKETYLDEFHQIGRVFGNIMARVSRGPFFARLCKRNFQGRLRSVLVSVSSITNRNNNLPVFYTFPQY